MQTLRVKCLRTGAKPPHYASASAAGAVVPAAGDEQHDPHPRAIGDVTIFDHRIIHDAFLNFHAVILPADFLLLYQLPGKTTSSRAENGKWFAFLQKAVILKEKTECEVRFYVFL